MRTMPFWAAATLVTGTEPPLDFQVSLEDLVSDAGRLVDGDLSRYEANGTRFQAGDVLFGKLRPYLAKSWLADREGTAGGDIHVYRPTAGVEPRYLHYQVRHRNFVRFAEAASKGTKMPRAEWSSIREFSVSLPSQAVQRAIAGYLDRETGEIDAMIGKLDRLVEKLEEHRRAVSANTLAVLFDGENKPLWNVLRPTKDQNHPHEEVLSVYRDYGVIPKSSRDDNHNRTPADVSSYQLVRPADVVINKMKAWQGSLGVSAYRGIVSPDYQVARPIGEVVPAYLHAVLRSPTMVPHYRVRSRGVRPAQWRLYWEDFANLRIPLPPLDEQHRIASHLDEVTGQIDVMLGKAAQLKELLTERRAALITDVVTGKKEIE
jgi:type I restriction enzyme S subunit